MRLSILFLSVLARGAAQEAPVDADQFARLMAALHAEIHDASFVYEGRLSLLLRGEPRDAYRAGRQQIGPGYNYQGLYAYREDGAILLDAFETDSTLEGIVDTRQSATVLRGKSSAVTRFPELRHERPVERPGGPGSLNQPGSPSRIVYLWFFKRLGDPKARNYRFHGWEEIDGHRCLKVQIDSGPGKDANRPNHSTNLFWIDMERGGHPLRVEVGPVGLPRMQTAGIELARLPLGDGKETWFPVRGYTEFYGFDDRSYPAGVESYFILDGSVRFNQGLPDAVFTVEEEPRLAMPPKLDQMRRKFRKPQPPQDPEGMKRRLTERLAQAEAKSPPIVASSPARQPDRTLPTLQIGLSLLGILLIGVGIWKLRTR